MILKKHLL